MSFGRKLKLLREEKKMYQSELAELLNLAPSSISMYEKDERDPDTSTVKKIAEIFNVSTDYLLGVNDSEDITELKESMYIKENLSLRLRNLLNEYDMSQSELSKRSSVTEATISNFLNCKQLPKLEIVSKISDVLNVSVDYLLGKTDVKQSITEPIEIAASMKDKADLSQMSDKDKAYILDLIERLKGKSE